VTTACTVVAWAGVVCARTVTCPRSLASSGEMNVGDPTAESPPASGQVGKVPEPGGVGDSDREEGLAESCPPVQPTSRVRHDAMTASTALMPYRRYDLRTRFRPLIGTTSKMTAA